DDNFGADYAGQNVLANDEDPGQLPLVALLEQGPANGTVQLNSSGTFVYQPNSGFAGEDTFSYRASNGELLSAVATVTLLVIADPTVAPPVAVDDEFVGDFSGGNLITNDLYANPQDLTAVKVSDPEQGSVQVNPDGSFTYRPFAGFSGNDSFTYLLRDPDGLESNVASVTLVVEANAAAEGSLEDKTDADGTSVLANATPNELALARELDTICTNLDPANADQQDLLDVCGNLRKQGTTAQQVLDALSVITPEELAAVAKTVRVLSFSQFRNHGSRMARVRQGTRGVSLAGLNLNYENSQVSGNTLDNLLQESLGMGASGDEMLAGSRLGVFVTGDLSFGDQDRTGLESGFDFDSQTLTVGMDYRLTDYAFLGTSLSMGKAEVTFDDDLGETRTDNYAWAVYGSLYSGNGYVDGIVSYGWSDVDTERNINYRDFGGSVERTASGSTDGSEYYVSVNAGYSFNTGGFRLDPLVRFFYLDGSVDGFTETGAQGLNLAISDSDFESMTLSASGQLSYMFLPSWGVITPYLRLEYIRELEDSAAGVRYRFANDPFADSVLQLQVDDPDTGYMVYGAGVAAQFAHGFSGFVSYQALGGYDGLSGETVSFGARWELAF
ncbi:MAG TPA: autotransporter domain-containing protein, partial [Kineobactrum sp.]